MPDDVYSKRCRALGGKCSRVLEQALENERLAIGGQRNARLLNPSRPLENEGARFLERIAEMKVKRQGFL